MTVVHLILRLTCVLYVLYSGVSAQVGGSFPDVPTPVDCELTKWGEWSECDPCTNHRYRSRSIVKFGQYGGKPCLMSLGEHQRCKATRTCQEKPIDCGNDFECESGRCIKQRLLCNEDNDCGDSSDELCDDGKDPKPVCRTDIELSEIGRTAGDGFNVLGMETKRNPFDNEFYNGVCDRVRDGNTRTYYRKPWNVAALVYQTRADRSFTTETYEDAVELVTKIVQEKTLDFDVSFSVKVTPTERNDTTIKGKLGFNVNRTENIQKVKEYSNKKSKQFLRVLGSVQLGTFQMRTRNTMLSPIFIEDLNNLPSFYQKTEYFAFIEMYGTHYAVSGAIGGKFELVYVLDTISMKSQDVTSRTVTTCLGFDAGISLEAKGVDVSGNIKPSHCDKIISYGEGKESHSSVIENTISFVEGGTVTFATGLDAKLSKKDQEINAEYFSKWASSIVDAPVIIKKKLEPIYTLIPTDLRDAYQKTNNLERAIEEYLEEYNVCKCQPCQNGGTVVLLDGECVCKCPLEFTGIACETLKHDLLKKPARGPEGTWSCWSSSSSCANGEKTRTRKCNQPSGATPCRGDSVRRVPC